MTPPYDVFCASSKFVSNWSFYLVSPFCSVSPQQKPGHAGVLCSGHFWLWWQHPGPYCSLKTRLPLPRHRHVLSDIFLLLTVFLSPWGHSSLSQNFMELSFSGSKIRVFSLTKYLDFKTFSKYSFSLIAKEEVFFEWMGQWPLAVVCK